MSHTDSNRKISDLTVEQFEEIVSRAVEKTIEDVLLDPDRGLTVRSEVIDRLRQSAADVETGERVYSAEEVAEKTGLDWK